MLIFSRHLLRESILNAGLRIIVGTKFYILIPAHLCNSFAIVTPSQFAGCCCLCACLHSVTLTSWVFFWSLWFCHCFCIGSPWCDTGPHQSLMLPFALFLLSRVWPQPLLLSQLPLQFSFLVPVFTSYRSLACYPKSVFPSCSWICAFGHIANPLWAVFAGRNWQRLDESTFRIWLASGACDHFICTIISEYLLANILQRFIIWIDFGRDKNLRIYTETKSKSLRVQIPWKSFLQWLIIYL